MYIYMCVYIDVYIYISMCVREAKYRVVLMAMEAKMQLLVH